ncbi:MAG: YchJ family protein [Acidobacteria bacterium]|nr:YchJ family protein [Acidobacteriota bacterium]MCB9399468.1 YchJ family protein [Acidobacteriota bacterium]
MLCPCDSGQPYDQCCQPIHLKPAHARTAEALMRSRYSAFVLNLEDYLWATLHPSSRIEAERPALHDTLETTRWLGLSVLDRKEGGPDDAEGWVLFEAQFETQGHTFVHRENSHFVREDRWYFTAGNAHYHPASAKTKPNAPCPCGSGKKYKKCCGRQG